MATLDNILKFKKQVTIIDPNGGEAMAKVWVRLLGDEDLKEAFKYARIASAATRAELRDANSIEYKDAIAQLDDVPSENLEVIIVASREQEFINEASLVVIREDLPKLEDISSRPDAPSLEDQERLDRLTEELEEKYEASVRDYVTTRSNELQVELEALSRDDLLKEAKTELANLNALSSFSEEIKAQRAYRAVYDDEACTIRSFSSLEAYKNAAGAIKDQILEAYDSLEIPANELKN